MADTMFPGPKSREICKHSSFEPICSSTLGGTIISWREKHLLASSTKNWEIFPQTCFLSLLLLAAVIRQDFKGSRSVAWVQKDGAKLPHPTLTVGAIVHKVFSALQ